MTSRRVCSLILGTCLLAPTACLSPEESTPLDPGEGVLAAESLELEVVDIDYDEVAQGITPCWLVPVSLWEAAQEGESYVVSAKLDYAAGRATIQLEGLAQLHSMKVTEVGEDHVQVEMFLPGPKPDDFEAVQAEGKLVEALALQAVDVDYDAINQGIQPCWLVPSDLWEEAQNGAGHVVLASASYEAGRYLVALEEQAKLSELAVTEVGEDHVQVEMLMPGPEPDDLEKVELSGMLVPE